MRRRLILALLGLTLPLYAQSAPAKPTDPQQQQDPDEATKPKRSLKKHLKEHFSSWCVGVPVSRCFGSKEEADAAQQQAEEQKKPADAKDTPTPPAAQAPVPEGESSSRTQIIDLSPPKSERDRPIVEDFPETREVQKWDPHKAAKNVEVGDYYFKKGNYQAALSRYEEALEWKSNHALAAYQAAQCEEKLGQPDDARRYYEKYLTVLPKGPLAADARQALARLGTAPNASPRP